MSKNQQLLTERVKGNLLSTEQETLRLRTANTRLLVAGIVSSATATLVTGLTAAQGPLVGEGIPGWRLACAVGAVFAFAATVCAGLGQQLKLSERLARCNQVLGRLKALDLAIDTGSRDWDEISQEYTEILKVHPEISLWEAKGNGRG